MEQEKVVIVTGSNKGIGHALVAQIAQLYPRYKVILTSRDLSLGEKARQAIIEKCPSAQNTVFLHQLDIKNPRSRETFLNEIKEKYGRVDILIHNAAVSHYVPGATDNFDTIIGTNYIATIDFNEEMLPLLSDTGRVIMVSSGLSELSNQNPKMQEFFRTPQTMEQLNAKLDELKKADQEGNLEDFGKSFRYYSTAKAFMNAYTKWVLAPKLKEGQFCFGFNPGWCPTEVSGFKGNMTTEEGGKTALYLMDLESEKCKEVNGKYYDMEGKVSDA